MKKCTMVLFAISMVFASLSQAATAVDANTVLGKYLIKAEDVYLVAQVKIQKNAKAVMKLSNGEGGAITCKGTYSFDDQTMVLKTNFPQCGDAPLVAHTIDLSGQSVESLKAEIRTSIGIDFGDGDAIPGLPVSIQKI